MLLTLSYGEKGYAIIHATLCDLFPPDLFVPSETHPLTPLEFIQLILMPEAVVPLIMADLHQPCGQAIITMRRSANYGVAMFPDDKSDAAQTIVERQTKERRRRLSFEAAVSPGPSSRSSTDTVTVRPWPRQRIPNRSGESSTPH